MLKLLSLVAVASTVSSTLTSDLDEIVRPQLMQLAAFQSYDLNHVCQCSVLSQSDSLMTIKLQTPMSVFEIELGNLDRDLTSTAKHKANVDGVIVDVDVSNHKWMGGQVRDHPGSTARMHIDTSSINACDDLSGMFNTKNGTYVIERRAGELLIVHETEALKSNMDLPNGDCQSMHQSKTYEDFTNTSSSNTKHRRRRATNDKGCSVFLDADDSFYQEWKGACVPGQTTNECARLRITRVTVKMIDTLHMVDAIFRADSVVGNLVELHLAGTHILNKNLFNDNVIAGDAVGIYKDWLAPAGIPDYVRGNDSPQADEVCLNHLFTHVDFSGSTVGIAYTGGGDNNGGGVCGTKGRNSGCTSSMSTSGPAQQWYMIRVTAHEIGHNLGSTHDTENCGSNYLMESFVSNSRTSSTAERLSSCSQASIRDTITKLGSTGRQDNCFGVVANPCHGDGDKKCCVGDQLSSKGTLCRAKDPLKPCIADAACDGVRPECPMGKDRPNNALCEEKESDPHGTCYNGVCSEVNSGYCAAFFSSHGYSNTGGCSFANNECVRACFISDGVTCVATGSTCGLSGWTMGDIKEEGCPKAPTDTPCLKNGVDGLCDSGGACQPCASGKCGLNYGATDFTMPPSPDWSRPPTPAPVCRDSERTGYTDVETGAPISCPDLIGRYRQACDDYNKDMCPFSCEACRTPPPPTTRAPTRDTGDLVAPCFNTDNTGYARDGVPLTCDQLANYCTNNGDTGDNVRFYCPVTCSSCPTKCEDLASGTGYTSSTGAPILCGDMDQFNDLSCSTPGIAQVCPLTCNTCEAAQARCTTCSANRGKRKMPNQDL